MRAAARLAGAELCGGKLTGVDDSGATGVYSVCGLAVEHKRGMGNRPGCQAGLGEALEGRCDGEGGAAQRGSPERARLGRGGAGMCVQRGQGVRAKCGTPYDTLCGA